MYDCFRFYGFEMVPNCQNVLFVAVALVSKWTPQKCDLLSFFGLEVMLKHLKEQHFANFFWRKMF